jgi:hypothetical protein
MSAWRRIAIERMPTLRQKISAARNPFELWIELRYVLHTIYERDIVEDKLVAAIYDYASWCLAEGDGDIPTATLVCFYEDIPTDPLICADVGRWLTEQDFDDLRSFFGYHLSETELDAFHQEFLAQRKALGEK